MLEQQLLAAETIDPDGTVHPVGPEAIRDVQEPRSAGAPSFEDGVLRTVIFPGVAISLVVFGTNLLGDALRDLLDPRLRH